MLVKKSRSLIYPNQITTDTACNTLIYNLFIYGMVRAINTGMVKNKTYNASITKAWNAKRTDASG